jgi:hypothetical protein
MTDLPSRPPGSLVPLKPQTGTIPSQRSQFQPPGPAGGRTISGQTANPPGTATGPTIRGQIAANPNNPNWRKRLRMASFKNAPFYVEQQGRSSGRRLVIFEYPKRDMPFTEDMGRVALRYQMTGYLIQAPGGGGAGQSNLYNGMDRDYDVARDRLETVLLAPNPGVLKDPFNPRLQLNGYNGNLQFYCEKYSIVEAREKGGFAIVEMSFVEAGLPIGTAADMMSASQVQSMTDALVKAQADAVNNAQVESQSQAPVPPSQIPQTPVPPAPQGPPEGTAIPPQFVPSFGGT